MKIAEPINQLLSLGAKHALFFKDSSWYHELDEFPGVLIDTNGYIRFDDRTAYLNYPGLEFGPSPNQVHIRPYGIAGLPDYQPFSNEQLTLLQKSGILNSAPVVTQILPEPISEETLKWKREVELYKRDKKLVSKLKSKYKNTCQICGTQLKIRSKGPKYYSEIHHIKGLGAPHHGPDIMSNMICVCPDHHTRLDFFTFPLDLKLLKLKKHEIDASFIDYHNKQVKIYNP